MPRSNVAGAGEPVLFELTTTGLLVDATTRALSIPEPSAATSSAINLTERPDTNDIMGPPPVDDGR
jgi:hypothetical protein